MIHEMDTACWYLVDRYDQPFDLDGTVHYPTEAKANGAAERYGRIDRPLMPRALGYKCVIVTCATCGDDMGDGVFEPVHFDNESEARTAATDLGWSVGDPDGVDAWCPDCHG